MSGLNKVMLIGRLGKDPEVKDAKGMTICNFTIATSKEWKDDSGEKQEKTEWHSVVCFKKTAEIAGKYLTKGKQVYVEGEIQTRSWDDKETGVKKYRTEIIANNIQFIGDNKNQTSENISNETVSKGAAAPQFNDKEELPF